MKSVLFFVLFFSLAVLYTDAFTTPNPVTITATVTVIAADITSSNANSSVIPASSNIPNLSNQAHILNLTDAIISTIYNHAFAPSTYANNVFSGTFEIIFETGANFVQSLKLYST
jgi:hypothetical protein